MAEDKVAFERDCERRRGDLARIQNKRVQEFDLLTTTAGLDLLYIVQATEPSSPAETVPPDHGRPASCISDSPTKSFLQPLFRTTSHQVTSSSADAPSLLRSQPAKPASKDQRASASRVVPQYVPVVTPKPKPTPEKPTPETTRL